MFSWKSSHVSHVPHVTMLAMGMLLVLPLDQLPVLDVWRGAIWCLRCGLCKHWQVLISAQLVQFHAEISRSEGFWKRFIKVTIMTSCFDEIHPKRSLCGKNLSLWQERDQPELWHWLWCTWFIRPPARNCAVLKFCASKDQLDQSSVQQVMSAILELHLVWWCMMYNTKNIIWCVVLLVLPFIKWMIDEEYIIERSIGLYELLCQGPFASCSIDEPEKWCSDEWCYVHPDCTLASKSSSYRVRYSELLLMWKIWWDLMRFDEIWWDFLWISVTVTQIGRFYSYSQCGYLDRFTSEYVEGRTFQGQLLNVVVMTNSGGWKGSYCTREDGEFSCSGPTWSLVNDVIQRTGAIQNLTMTFFGGLLANYPQAYAQQVMDQVNRDQQTSAFTACAYATGMGYIDVCIGAFTAKPSRDLLSLNIDLWSEPVYLISPKAETNNDFFQNLTRAFSPFDSSVWLCIAAFLFVASMLVMLQERSVHSEQFKHFSLPQAAIEASYIGAMGFFSGAQGFTPHSLGGRMTSLAMGFVILLILAQDFPWSVWVSWWTNDMILKWFSLSLHGYNCTILQFVHAPSITAWLRW